jgi:ParB family chromosome partitioning protein
VARRSGLGRGLGALIPTDTAGDGSSILAELPLASIEPNPNQPRTVFDEDTLAGLAASIVELGVLQPVLVRATGDERYQLIAGERRWRAAKRAGLQTIPAIVRTVDDITSVEQALVENLHRADLNALDEAAAYQQLIEDFALTHDDLATRLGKSRAAVSNSLRLFQLPPTIQRLVKEEQLSAGHARALLGTPDRAYQEALAKRAVAEGLSVRAVEAAVRVRGELGQSPASEATTKVRALRDPGYADLEGFLSEYLQTRVKVSPKTKKNGQMVIEFADLEDLERIFRSITEPRPET